MDSNNPTPRKAGEPRARLGSIRSGGDATMPVSTRRGMDIMQRSGELTRGASQPNIGSQSAEIKKERTFTPNVNAPRRSLQKDEIKTQGTASALPLTMTLIRMAQSSSNKIQEKEQMDGTALRRRRQAAQNLAASSNSAVYARMMNRKKEKKEGKSLDLADISWTSEGLYTPTTLPFVERDAAVQEGGDGSNNASQGVTSASDMRDILHGSSGPSRRPKIAIVDEMSGKAGHLFQAPEGLGNHEVVLLQLPSLLPALLKEGQQSSSGTSKRLTQHAAAETAYQPSGLSGLRTGHVGKLRIHKSGKVRLHLGDVSFSVDQGVDSHFAQEAVAVVNDAELMKLGPLHKKAVITPDVFELTEALRRAQPFDAALDDIQLEGRGDSDPEEEYESFGVRTLRIATGVKKIETAE